MENSGCEAGREYNSSVLFLVPLKSEMFAHAPSPGKSAISSEPRAIQATPPRRVAILSSIHTAIGKIGISATNRAAMKRMSP
jgi:hypothetical protein